MSNNFATFNAAFPPQQPGAGGRPYQAPPMTMVPQRSSGPMMPGQMARELQLRPPEVQFYDSLFYSCEGSRTLGLVSGGAIKGLFTQSRLPKQTLATIWNLSDTQKRKVLDLDNFYMAMRLIAIAQQNLPITLQSLKSYTEIPLPQFEGQQPGGGAGMGGGMPPLAQIPAQSPMSSVPSAAPAAGGAPARKMPPMTSVGGGLGTGMPMPMMQPGGGQAPNSNAQFPVSMGRAPSLGPAMTPPAAAASDEWVMSDTERAQYVSLFGQADADGDGFVGGKEANLFFKQSGLDNATLKQIWLLADVDRDNRLNPDEFAVAMHLTLRVRKKQPLPAVLPASMDPRNKHAPQAEAPAGGKSRLNMDLLPELPSQQPPQQDMLSFDAGAPRATPGSKPQSRRGSQGDFGFSHQPNAGGFMPSANSLPSPAFALGLPPQSQFGFNNAAPSPSVNGGFGSSLTPAPVQGQQPAQGYHMIEATQTFEDRTSQLQTLQNQTDGVKRQQAGMEERLVEKRKQIEEVELKVQSQQQMLEQQRGVLQGLEDEAKAADGKLAASQKALSDAQESLKNGDAQIRTLTEHTAQAKRDTQEADMSLALLESQLTALRSNLKAVEELKDGQLQILQARREQQNRLLLEKQEITELLQSSKAELAQIKEQANIIRDGLQSTQESVDHMHDMLKEHREIVAAEKLKPSKSIAKSPMPIVSPPASTGSTTSAAKKSETPRAKAAAFNFGEHDDAFNIDDIGVPTAITTTTPASTVAKPSAPAAAPPAPLPSPVVAAASVAAASAAAAAASAPQHKSRGSVSDLASQFEAKSSASAAPQKEEPAKTKVVEPSFGEEDDTFGAPSTSTLHVDSGAAASHHREPSANFASPPAPAVPSFPSALEGTGVPEFPSPAHDVKSPWDDDANGDADDPFGASSGIPAAGGNALSPQAAFGELDDPFGGPASSGCDDPFAAGSATSAPAKEAASGGFDDFGASFDAFGSTAKPAAADAPKTNGSTVPAGASTAPPATDAKKAIAANFDAAMADDWAADFD